VLHSTNPDKARNILIPKLDCLFRHLFSKKKRQKPGSNLVNNNTAVRFLEVSQKRDKEPKDHKVLISALRAFWFAKQIVIKRPVLLTQVASERRIHTQKNFFLPREFDVV
jgi:hypothetical protein